jgi:hypothetical protein
MKKNYVTLYILESLILILSIFAMEPNNDNIPNYEEDSKVVAVYPAESKIFNLRDIDVVMSPGFTNCWFVLLTHESTGLSWVMHIHAESIFADNIAVAFREHQAIYKDGFDRPRFSPNPTEKDKKEPKTLNIEESVIEYMKVINKTGIDLDKVIRFLIIRPNNRLIYKKEHTEKIQRFYEVFKARLETENCTLLSDSQTINITDITTNDSEYIIIKNDDFVLVEFQKLTSNFDLLRLSFSVYYHPVTKKLVIDKNSHGLIKSRFGVNRVYKATETFEAKFGKKVEQGKMYEVTHIGYECYIQLEVYYNGDDLEEKLREKLKLYGTSPYIFLKPEEIKYLKYDSNPK